MRAMEGTGWRPGGRPTDSKAGSASEGPGGLGQAASLLGALTNGTVKWDHFAYLTEVPRGLVTHSGCTEAQLLLFVLAMSWRQGEFLV